MTNKQSSTADLRTHKKSSGGPKTPAGKRHVRLNALKHGFFSRELVVNEIDKAEFDGLRQAIRTQLSPTTSMRGLACDRVVAATWRFKLALRMEMERLRPSNPENQQVPTDKSPLEQEPRWYLSSPAELRRAQRMLEDLHEDIAHNGDIHLAQRKEWIENTFGVAFYQNIAEWQPVPADAILFAEHLAAHAEDFKKPLPGIDPSKRAESLRAYGRARWEMMQKVIQLKLQEITVLSHVLGQLQTEAVSQLRFIGVDGISRHITSAARELERSIDWYQYLLNKGL